MESTPSSAKDLGKKKPIFVPQTEDCRKPIQKGQRTVHDELAEAEARMLSGAGLAGAPIHRSRKIVEAHTTNTSASARLSRPLLRPCQTLCRYTAIYIISAP